VTNQLPVNHTQQIKVRLTYIQPQIQLGEMGIIEWELSVLPQERREINYQFTIEHPPELTVVELDI
jgi:hypothetical protein